MTQSLNTTPPFLNKLVKYPLSRIYFITIKDNADKWKIGKVNDWIRRYSTTYYIVRGVCGGNHFHLIAGIEKDRKLVPVKGIHFHITNLSDNKPIIIPSAEENEDKRKAAYFKRQNFLSQTVELSDETQTIITTIVEMVKKYWRSKTNKVKNEIKKTKVENRIDNVINYLQKNLDEPRMDDIDDPENRREYFDWIMKYK